MTAAILLRPAGPGDAEAIAAVHVASWRESYRGLMPDQVLASLSHERQSGFWNERLSRIGGPYAVLAAEDPDGIIGFCSLTPPRIRLPARFGEVEALYVLRRAQGRGLGRRLMASGARILAGQGCQSVSLWVLAGNHRARGFYERMGGVAAGSRVNPRRGYRLEEVEYRWEHIEDLIR